MSVFTDGSKSTRLNRRYAGISSVFLFVVILLSLLASNRPAIFSAAAHVWAVSDQVQHADAAVILGGEYETRPAAAAQLYENGDVKQILVSTAGYDDTGMAQAEDINRAELIRLGVPASAIVDFAGGLSNTYEEACALALWAEHNGVHRLVVPTEMFPSRRVRWILRRELGKRQIDVRVVTVSPTFYNFDNWWKRQSAPSDFAGEIMKYLYYRVRYWRS